MSQPLQRSSESGEGQKGPAADRQKDHIGHAEASSSVRAGTDAFRA